MKDILAATQTVQPTRWSGLCDDHDPADLSASVGFDGVDIYSRRDRRGSMGIMSQAVGESVSEMRQVRLFAGGDYRDYLAGLSGGDGARPPDESIDTSLSNPGLLLTIIASLRRGKCTDLTAVIGDTFDDRKRLLSGIILDQALPTCSVTAGPDFHRSERICVADV